MAAGMRPVQDALRKGETERAQAVVEGRAGGGAVTIAITGALEVKRVVIAPAAATGADVGMLEDLVAAALADALRQWRGRFGASPEEQIQRMLAGSDLGSLLGPLASSFGKKPG